MKKLYEPKVLIPILFVIAAIALFAMSGMNKTKAVTQKPADSVEQPVATQSDHGHGHAH